MRSNCLAYAIRKWAQEGGYIVARRSLHHRWLLHFAHVSPDGVWSSFVPVAPIEGWGALLHKVWFTGYVKKGAGPI